MRDAFEKKMSYMAYEEERKKNANLNGSDAELDDLSVRKLCDNKYIPLENCDRRDIEDDNKFGLFIQKENTDLDCGKIKIPIFYSMLVHSCAALYFLFVLSFCNIYYVWQLWWYHVHGTGVYICLVLAVFNIILLPTFITVQGMIKLRYKYFCKMKTLRMISFIFEGLSGLTVILLAVVGSMKRNNDVAWFDK